MCSVFNNARRTLKEANKIIDDDIEMFKRDEKK